MPVCRARPAVQVVNDAAALPGDGRQRGRQLNGGEGAPERVWPWLVQMGYGRGGVYTPEWVDLFANRWVFGVRHPFPASASRLLPE